MSTGQRIFSLFNCIGQIAIVILFIYWGAQDDGIVAFFDGVAASLAFYVAANEAKSLVKVMA